MSKPLELAVFEKEPGRYGGEPRYLSPDGFWAYPESHVDGYAADKRLTDAELAAEHWSYCTGWYAAVRADDDYEGGMWSRELQRRAVILERFATLPHYDEASL